MGFLLASGAMARVFITGSADGLGRLAAKALVEAGHEVVVHSRNAERVKDARKAVPGAKAGVAGDLASITQTRAVAERANALGPFDAVIHNAGVYLGPERRTEDGLPALFAINTLAPYILTALISRPKRLIYLSSGAHRRGDASLEDLTWKKRAWDSSQAYGDSKLHDVLLAFAAARLWPDTVSNAVNPGWVPTKMGGLSAPDDLDEGYRTQVWLAVSEEPAALVSGRYLFHRKTSEPHPAARDAALQDRLLAACRRLSGVAWEA